MPIDITSLEAEQFRCTQSRIESELQQVPNPRVVFFGDCQHSFYFVIGEGVHHVVGFCLLATYQFADLYLVERIPVDKVIVQGLIKNCTKWGEVIADAF